MLLWTVTKMDYFFFGDLFNLKMNIEHTYFVRIVSCTIFTCVCDHAPKYIQFSLLFYFVFHVHHFIVKKYKNVFFTTNSRDPGVHCKLLPFWTIGLRLMSTFTCCFYVLIEMNRIIASLLVFVIDYRKWSDESFVVENVFIFFFRSKRNRKFDY